MRRLIATSVFALVTVLTTSGSSFAAGGMCPPGVPSGITSCFFISAVGADTNTGTSEAASWLHAPGMTNCASTCASTIPAAGEGFIFKGGDTWHFGNSGASPYVGACSQYAATCWLWQWGGSSGSPIYIGVDKSWFTGGSWTRPIMTGDNPLSTSVVASCSYDESGLVWMLLDGPTVNYVTVDNFEWPGKCWSVSGYGSNAGSSIYDYQGLNNSFINNYFHGWTLTAGAIDNNEMINGNDPTLASGTTISYNVFDGSDSSQGTTALACQYAVNGSPCTSGMAIGIDAYNVDHNVFRYLSNGWIAGNTHDVHDNLFEYLYNPITGCWSSTGKNCSSGPNDGPHPNIFNTDGNASGVTDYFYNNVVRNNFQNVGMWFNVPVGLYFFNNVVWGSGSIGPQNCVTINNNTSSAVSVYVYNNTFDFPCTFRFDQANGPAPAFNGTAYFENNHLIGYANLGALRLCDTGATCTFTDRGSEIVQTESTANGQGYVTGNNYAPTLITNATVGAGANLTSSCSTFSADSMLCNGTTAGVVEQAGSGGMVAVSPAIIINARPGSGAWDVGAYQFGKGSAGPPKPATALTTVRQ